MSYLLSIQRHRFVMKLGLLVGLVGYADWLGWQGNGPNLAVWSGLASALLGALLLARPATLKTRTGLCIVAAAAFYAASMLHTGGLLPLALFWVAISVAALLPFASKLQDGWQWALRLAGHGFMAMVAPLIDLHRLSKMKARRGRRWPKLSSILAHLWLPAVGLGAFTALLAMANPVLESWLAAITISPPDGSLLARALLCSFFALLVWSVLNPWRRRKQRTTRTVPATLGGEPLPAIPLASIQLSLALFNGLFALQNGMDGLYLTGTLALPEGMTLAQYAHRGAYPLIGTALLAGLFVLLLVRPGSVAGSDRATRALVVAWIAQNMVLVASSMVRTWDYVEVYSLTQLRIAALVWMALVAVGLGLICWRLLRAKTGGWLINANLLAAGVVLSAFCIIDMGAIAARWNVTHAREVGGRGAALDLCHMSTLGSGALMPLVDLERRLPEGAFRQEVRGTRIVLESKASLNRRDEGWSLRNADRLRAARAAARDLPLAPVIFPDVHCQAGYSS